MTRLQLNRLFEDFKKLSYKQMGIKYNMSKSTMARWYSLGIVKVTELKFDDCVICNKEFYKHSPSQRTCSTRCSKKLKTKTHTLANKSYYDSLSDYDKYIDRKKRTIKQRIRRHHDLDRDD